MLHATIDAAGLATGFYDDRIHGEIPPGAFPITTEVWGAWIADTAGQRWDGRGLVAHTPVPPVPGEAQQRQRRDALLSRSDWTQGADVPLSAEMRSAWNAYRKALRDLPSQPGWPADVAWPAKPV